jgi:hypothetical protein
LRKADADENAAPFKAEVRDFAEVLIAVDVDADRGLFRDDFGDGKTHSVRGEVKEFRRGRETVCA